MRHPASDERLFALLSSPLARLQARDELWQYYFAYYTMLMAAALALLVRFGFDLLDRWLIPAPLRKAGHSIDFGYHPTIVLDPVVRK